MWPVTEGFQNAITAFLLYTAKMKAKSKRRAGQGIKIILKNVGSTVNFVICQPGAGVVRNYVNIITPVVGGKGAASELWAHYPVGKLSKQVCILPKSNDACNVFLHNTPWIPEY